MSWCRVVVVFWYFWFFQKFTFAFVITHTHTCTSYTRFWYNINLNEFKLNNFIHCCICIVRTPPIPHPPTPFYVFFFSVLLFSNSMSADYDETMRQFLCCTFLCCVHKHIHHLDKICRFRLTFAWFVISCYFTHFTQTYQKSQCSSSCALHLFLIFFFSFVLRRGDLFMVEDSDAKSKKKKKIEKKNIPYHIAYIEVFSPDKTTY